MIEFCLYWIFNRNFTIKKFKKFTAKKFTAIIIIYLLTLTKANLFHNCRFHYPSQNITNHTECWKLMDCSWYYNPLQHTNPFQFGQRLYTWNIYTRDEEQHFINTNASTFYQFDASTSYQFDWVRFNGSKDKIIAFDRCWMIELMTLIDDASPDNSS